MAYNKVKVLPWGSHETGAAFSSAVFQINAEKGTRTFYVHGDILSQNSQPFKSIVDGGWKESVEREINLEEWDADTVARMIDYLYTKDYTWQKNGAFKPVPIRVSKNSPSGDLSFRAARPLTPLSEFMEYSNASDLSYNEWVHGRADKEEGFGELLLMHAKVYALANYRAIEQLSELALDRLLRTLQEFKATEYDPQQIGYIVELVSYVYENTCFPFGEREPMRRAVTRFIALELTKLNSREEISVLMSTYGDFASDLLSDLTRRIKLAEVGCGIQHRYLAGLEVHTGASQPSNCIQAYQWGNPNINFGTPARSVWLVPYYTEDVSKACTSFKVIPYGQKGYDQKFRITTDLGWSNDPCLMSICDKEILRKVSHVLLVRVVHHWQKGEIQSQCLATGATDDIFGTAHADRLYLMWK